MKRLVTSILMLVAALAFAAPALAKEPKEATLCGPDECGTVSDRQLLLGVVGDDSSPGPPAPPGTYYKVRMTIDVPPDAGVAPHVDFWYVPATHALKAAGRDPYATNRFAWTILSPAAAAAFDKALRGVQAFPTPKVTSVKIGYRAVKDPSSYLRLLTVGGTQIAVPSTEDWQPVTFTGTPSPWTDNTTPLEYSPAANMLQRAGEVIKLSPSLAASIEAGNSLAPSDASFPWKYVAIAILALAAAAAAILLMRRLQREPKPALET